MATAVVSDRGGGSGGGDGGSDRPRLVLGLTANSIGEVGALALLGAAEAGLAQAIGRGTDADTRTVLGQRMDVTLELGANRCGTSCATGSGIVAWAARPGPPTRATVRSIS